MDIWRLITTWGAPPGFNMALDEALLAPDAAPTVRFYTWGDDTLSLGYFQRFEDVPAAKQTDVVVRRLTGGGAIHHAEELTFSIAANADHPLFAGPIPKSYERIHGILAESLELFGIEASLRGEEPAASDREATGMCFHHSTSLDLMWNGAKGVGSAQRRTGGRVLHHGSIKLGTTVHEGEIATIRDASEDAEVAEVARAFEGALALRMGVRFERGVPTAEERAHAHERGPFFRSRGFVRRR